MSTLSEACPSNPAETYSQESVGKTLDDLLRERRPRNLGAISPMIEAIVATVEIGGDTSRRR